MNSSRFPVPQFRLSETMIGVAAVAAALAWPILLTVVGPVVLFVVLERVGLLRWTFATGLTLLIVVVSPHPWLLFLAAARDEPFAIFSANQAIHFLGGGTALLVVVVELALLVVFGVVTRRLSRWWLPVLLWLVLLGLVAFAGAAEWVGDLQWFTYR